MLAPLLSTKKFLFDFSLSRYNLGFTSSCKTGSKLSINKIVKMITYLMCVVTWKIQYYMKDWDLSEEYFEIFQKKRG